LLEALTWVGLLIGMAFKYLPADGNEIGVKIFGPLHGAAFLLYLPVASWTIYRLRWGFFTGLGAIVASLPPFGTLLFERWVARTGRLAELSTPS
jgi:integral membrane protein